MSGGARRYKSIPEPARQLCRERVRRQGFSNPGHGPVLFPTFYNFHDVGVGVAATEVVTLSNNTASAVTISSFAFGGTIPETLTLTAAVAIPLLHYPLVQLLRARRACSPYNFCPRIRARAVGDVYSQRHPGDELSGSGGAPQVSLSTPARSTSSHLRSLNVPSDFVRVDHQHRRRSPPRRAARRFRPPTPRMLLLLLCAIYSGCSIAIPPGGSCEISLLFLPTTANSGNPFNATLLINDNAAGSPQSVSLSGPPSRK